MGDSGSGVTLTSPTVAGSSSIVGSTISGNGRGRPVALGLGGRFNSTQHDERRRVKAEFTSLAALRSRFDQAKQNCGLSVRLQDENSRFFLELSLLKVAQPSHFNTVHQSMYGNLLKRAFRKIILIVQPALLSKLPDYRRKPGGLS